MTPDTVVDEPAATIPPGTTLRVPATRAAGSRSRCDLAGELDDVPYKVEFNSFASGPLVNEGIAADKVDVGTMGDVPAPCSPRRAASRRRRRGPPPETGGAPAPRSWPTRARASRRSPTSRAAPSPTPPAPARRVRAPGPQVGRPQQGRRRAGRRAHPGCGQRARIGGRRGLGQSTRCSARRTSADNPDGVALVSITDMDPTYNFLLSPRDPVEAPAQAATIEDFVARLAHWGEGWRTTPTSSSRSTTSAGAPGARETPGWSYELAGRADLARTDRPTRWRASRSWPSCFTEGGLIPEEVDLGPAVRPELTSRFSNAIKEA